jgi:hypothetical protein
MVDMVDMVDMAAEGTAVTAEDVDGRKGDIVI